MCACSYSRGINCRHFRRVNKLIHTIDKKINKSRRICRSSLRQNSTDSGKAFPNCGEIAHPPRESESYPISNPIESKCEIQLAVTICSPSSASSIFRSPLHVCTGAPDDSIHHSFLSLCWHLHCCGNTRSPGPSSRTPVSNC